MTGSWVKPVSFLGFQCANWFSAFHTLTSSTRRSPMQTRSVGGSMGRSVAHGTRDSRATLQKQKSPITVARNSRKFAGWSGRSFPMWISWQTFGLPFTIFAETHSFEIVSIPTITKRHSCWPHGSWRKVRQDSCIPACATKVESAWHVFARRW